MTLRLRQIALAARDLDAVRADIAAVFGLGYAYEDPGVAKYGLANAVFPLGETFLEVVSPKAVGTSAGRFLDRRRGDGGYMVILQTEALAEARDRARAAGVRIVDQFDGEGAAFTHLHPRDVGGAILSIDFMDPKDRWDWGGPSWRAHRSGDLALAIVGAELQSDAPDRMALRWAEVLGLEAQAIDYVWKIALEGGELRFTGLRDDRGEGLRTFDVKTDQAAAIRTAAENCALLDVDGAILLAGTRLQLIVN